MSVAPWLPLTSSPDLIREREGHCSALATLHDDDVHEPPSDYASGGAARFVVCVGGYVEGSFEPDAIAARVPTPRIDDNCGGGVGVLKWFVCGRHPCCEVDGMSMCADDDGRRFLLFGGLDGSSYEPRSALVEARWSMVTSTKPAADLDASPANGEKALHLDFHALCSLGDVPTARWRHAAAMVQQRMWVFGGTTATEEQSNDLYVIDVASLVWRRVDGPTTPSVPHARLPPPRFLTAWVPINLPLCQQQATATVGAVPPLTTRLLLVMFGGARFVDGNQASLNDVWALDLQAQVWQQVAVGVNRPHAGNTRDGTNDEGAVVPRVNGHVALNASATLLQRIGGDDPGSAVVLFFAGKDFATGTNDIIRFDLRWGTTPETQGTVEASSMVRVPVKGREGSGMTSVDDAAMFVSDGTAPYWRYTPSLVVLPPNAADRANCGSAVDALLIGGQCRHNDPVSVYGFRSQAMLPKE